MVKIAFYVCLVIMVISYGIHNWSSQCDITDEHKWWANPLFAYIFGLSGVACMAMLPWILTH